MRKRELVSHILKETLSLRANYRGQGQQQKDLSGGCCVADEGEEPLVAVGVIRSDQTLMHFEGRAKRIC